MDTVGLRIQAFTDWSYGLGCFAVRVHLTVNCSLTLQSDKRQLQLGHDRTISDGMWDI